MSHITKLLPSQDELYHRATGAMVGEQYQSYWSHHMRVKLQLVRQSCEGYITEPHGAMAELHHSTTVHTYFVVAQVEQGHHTDCSACYIWQSVT